MINIVRIINYYNDFSGNFYLSHRSRADTLESPLFSMVISASDEDSDTLTVASANWNTPTATRDMLFGWCELNMRVLFL